MHGRGACMTGGHAWQRDMHGMGWGVCGRGCACLEVVYVAGVCMAGGLVCMAGGMVGMHGRGCVAGGGMHATADTMGYGQ